MKSKVEYLGHILSDKGISPDTKKIEAIKNYPVPKNLDQLRSFLRLASYYYRKFVRNFSTMGKGKIAQSELQKSQLRQKDYYDRKAVEFEFKVGESVLLKEKQNIYQENLIFDGMDPKPYEENYKKI